MEDNEWETIQASTSTTQSDEDDGDTVVVTRPTNLQQPPINHETLPVFPQPPPPQDNLQQPPLSPLSSHSFTSTTDSTEIIDGELPYTPEVRNTLLKTSLGILSSWVMRIAYGIRSRIGIWSFVTLTAFMTLTATAYARRWQRWRKIKEKDNTNQLLLLLDQKDEKIKQLLLQIDRLNEALLARRRVPVFRVVVDNPVVIGPRSNWKST
ncbi:uncharacterized protein [Rutidosis leptorrhynchoides]|uniref:uncharacterized protein n=1 Tax=Rutidosis leptorrhynchoides TaxID=125765 RepID=UPI003A9A0EF8